MIFLCRILATRLRHIRIDPSGQLQDPVLLPRHIYLYILHILLSLLYTRVLMLLTCIIYRFYTVPQKV